MSTRAIVHLIVITLVAAGCGGSAGTVPATPSTPTPATSMPPTPTTVASTPPASIHGGVVAPLEDGPITPGRYRHRLVNACDTPPMDCPAQATPPPALGIDVTVPAGWEAFPDFHLIAPAGTVGDTASGGGLVLGWTNFHVGLSAEPCAHESHHFPDISVGPTVDDFVDAVVAHPTLDVTDATSAEVGGRPGRKFTLTGPSSLAGCVEWRPWDPGFFAQGPDNTWDVWVVDVGYRVVIVAQSFPDTPATVTTQLRGMVDSISFAP